MKASALKYTILSAVATMVICVLALMPFHAFLTVWLSSLVGHYTILRLWKEALLLLGVGGVLYLLITDTKIRTHTLPRRLTQLILLYGLLQGLLGLIAFQKHQVDAKALAYGLLLNLRFLAFFLICWSVALRTSRLRTVWLKTLLIPAGVVVAFGLLQMFILPNDFLVHFGYGPHTIPAFETINHNSNYIRIASTLRGANPLGAYLLIPLSVLTVLLVRGKRNWQTIVFWAASLLALTFSFSRSAWIGAFLSMAVIVILGGWQSARLRRGIIIGLPVLVVGIVGTGLLLKSDVRFENVFLHTQAHSSVATTSNDGHLSALKGGIHDLVHEPFGRGPGTAGPASVYNAQAPRIAENYFVQLGQETGWLGLFLFLLINAGVGYLLWLRRQDNLALSMLAALIGISFINLLSHAWTDDTLAYVWWGLAGIAVATLPQIETIQVKPKAKPKR